MLAQHWGIGAASSDFKTEVKTEKDNRSQSVDVGAVQRINMPGPTPPPPKPQRSLPQPQRDQSISSLPSENGPPSRTGSAQLGAKRPRLKVQIPEEQTEDGSATGSSPHGSGNATGSTPARTSTEASHSSGVVLPPPSPSASALLSAGAQGPPNPFARPHPPMTNSNPNTQAYNNNNIETPISALPSRFVAEGLLPSPSSFYPEWGFGRTAGESNMLPSPLNFQTPVAANGSSFSMREEDGERKRKSPDGESTGQEAGNVKRVKA